jgi:group I intron endonuclease
MNTGIIYIFRNIINGKCYIGKTNRLFTQRINEHKRNSKKTNTTSLLHKAIQKYSWDKFDIQIIESGIETQLLNEREIFNIKKYNSYYTNHGYNLTLGGDGGSMPKNIIDQAIQTKRLRGNINHTLTAKQKISNSMTGVKKSNEHCKHISNSRIGWVPSAETRKRMSDSKKGNIPWNKGKTGIVKHINSKKIIVNDIIYKSAVDAAKQLNMSTNAIRYRLKTNSFINWRFYNG